MKVYSTTSIGAEFIADLEFRINSPSSGFSFCFGRGSGESFITGLAFSGRSGYLFDQDENFFGGYKSGQRFDLQVHCFSDGRASYFYDGVLIANDLECLLPINTIEFDKIGGSSVSVQLSSEDYESIDPDAIMYNGSILLYNGQNILFS